MRTALSNLQHALESFRRISQTAPHFAWHHPLGELLEAITALERGHHPLDALGEYAPSADLPPEEFLTYFIGDDGTSIRCKRCGMVSYQVEDVKHRYCGKCKVFHDDIHRDARRHWVSMKPGEAISYHGRLYT